VDETTCVDELEGPEHLREEVDAVRLPKPFGLPELVRALAIATHASIACAALTMHVLHACEGSALGSEHAGLGAPPRRQSAVPVTARTPWPGGAELPKEHSAFGAIRSVLPCPFARRAIEATWRSSIPPGASCSSPSPRINTDTEPGRRAA
jgi:hypothetical protein